jgi:hypothetical protein
MPGTTAPFGPIYPLSEKELLALRECLKPNLEAGKVRRSSSSAGAPNHICTQKGWLIAVMCGL